MGRIMARSSRGLLLALMLLAHEGLCHAQQPMPGSQTKQPSRQAELGLPPAASAPARTISSSAMQLDAGSAPVPGAVVGLPPAASSASYRAGRSRACGLCRHTAWSRLAPPSPAGYRIVEGSSSVQSPACGCLPAGSSAHLEPAAGDSRGGQDPSAVWGGDMAGARRRMQQWMDGGHDFACSPGGKVGPEGQTITWSIAVAPQVVATGKTTASSSATTTTVPTAETSDER